MATSADWILKRYNELKTNRTQFESLWQQIAERVLPGSAQFRVTRRPGEQRTERMYDSTAALALRKYSTIIESMLTPRTVQWHRLTAPSEDLADHPEVKAYLDVVNDLLFRARYSPQSNFTGQVGAAYLELGAFGSSSLYVDDLPGYGLRYRAVPLSETYFSENHVGLIDTVFRRYDLTARQAAEAFGKDKLPRHIVNMLDRTPDSMHCFVQAIVPNDGETGRGVLADHRWIAVTICEAGGDEVRRAGFYTFPYAISRDLTSAGEIYGRSPAVWALPDVKMLNEMNRTVIRAAHKAVEPPMMMQEDGALQAFDFRPGAMNYGALGPNGEELARPMQSAARLDIGLEMMQAKQQVINEAFFITLFQILAENPKMTATEVMERAQEKGMLLGPLMGRQQSEFLGPLIERELDVQGRAGKLPPMPDVMIEAGGEYKIEYESPLARAQRADEGVSILRTFDALAQFAQVAPDIFDNFDLDESARALGQINGMRSKLIRPKDQVDAIRESRAQAQQQAQMAEAAPGVARAVKDLSQVAA